jgi:hypothetical protein
MNAAPEEFVLGTKYNMTCVADGVRTGTRHAILGFQLSHADLGLAPAGFPTGQNIFLLPN